MTTGTESERERNKRRYQRALFDRVASTVRTRHICSGMRFIDCGNGGATGSTLLTVFMHDGEGRGLAVPAVVGEDTDEFVRTDAGWQFASRTFETLFA